MKRNELFIFTLILRITNNAHKDGTILVILRITKFFYSANLSKTGDCKLKGREQVLELPLRFLSINRTTKCVHRIDSV